MAKKKTASPGPDAPRREWMYSEQLPAEYRGGLIDSSSHMKHGHHPLFSWRQLPDGSWQCTTKRPKVLTWVNAAGQTVNDWRLAKVAAGYQPSEYDQPDPKRLGIGSNPLSAQRDALAKWKTEVARG